MKIQIISDLHNNLPKKPIQALADVLVLAGDIAVGRSIPKDLFSNFEHVLYVLGNHEFYGRHIDWRPTDLPDNFILLDSTKVIINGVIFAGTTLWSHITDIYPAATYLNDFYNIHITDESGIEGQFTVRYYNWLFSQAKEWLLNTKWDVLITHHSPRLESIHPIYANSLCNDCFSSDINLPSNKIAIHGHTHKSFDYRLENNTRVVCSPWGYPAENIYPTMEKVIEV